MTRETLDKKLKHLREEILLMESMVRTATLKAVESLKRQDLILAKAVYAGDREINERRFHLENECITTIALQQPIMANDLRQVASTLEVVAELERMGDYAKGIAKITLLIGDNKLIKPLIDIPLMAEITVGMLFRAVTAYVNTDVEQARSIPGEDDRVDALYNQVYRDLVEIMSRDPSTIDQANHLMWAAHNLERMADRVTNICERTIYIGTGQLIELENSDDELTDSPPGA
jgi:phosphate transport system protein